MLVVVPEVTSDLDFLPPPEASIPDRRAQLTRCFVIRPLHLACHIAAAVVAAAAVPAAAQETLEAVELRLDNALQGGVASEKNWMRTAHLGLTFRGADAAAGRVGVGRGGRPGGWNVAGWSGRVERLAVQRENDRITGTVEVLVSSNTVGAGRHVFTLDARVNDGKATGSFTARHGDAAAAGKVSGTARPFTQAKTNPQDALYVVALDGSLPRSEVLTVYLNVEAGGVRNGFAFAPSFSRRPFEVDASGLTVRGTAVTGVVRILRVPPGSDVRKELGRYDLNLEVAGDRVSGTYAGTFEDKQMRGAVWGEASPRPPAPAPTQPLDVWLKLEDGLFGGADWQNRAFFKFTVVGGRGDAGSLTNNKGIYTARFDRARLDIDGGSLTGTLHGTVLSGGVTAGEYVFELDGWMIGDVLAGRFTTRKGGDQTKTGYFVGGVTPASP
jgi:hypothetical protein